MKKNNVKIKGSLSLSDRIAITNIVANNHFSENEVTGEIDYTPYFRELSFINSFAEYVLDGVEFDEEDDIYESVISDIELNDLYDDWTGTFEYIHICNYVNDMVEFKKQQLIHSKKSSLDSLLNTIADVVKKMDESLNMNDISALLPKLVKLGENFNQEEAVNQIINSISTKKKQQTAKDKATTLPLSDGE